MCLSEICVLKNSLRDLITPTHNADDDDMPLSIGMSDEIYMFKCLFETYLHSL